MLNRSLYIFSAKMLGYGIRILLPIILVRILTKAEYGTYRQFFLLEQVLALLFQFGVNQSLFYFVPRDEKNAAGYFVNGLVLNVVIYAAVFLVVWPLWDPLTAGFRMEGLRPHLAELAAYTTLLMLTTAADSYLCARNRIRPAAAFEVGGQLIVSLGALAAVWATGDLRWVFPMLVATRALHLVAVLVYVQFRAGGFLRRLLLVNIGTQLRYGVGLGLGGAAWALLLRVHPMIVSRQLGVEGFAVYANGITELPIVQYYTHSLAVVTLSRFALLEKAGDWAAIRDLWREILANLQAVLVPFVLLMVVLAEPLVLLMFTERYREAIPIFQINAVAKLALLWNPQLILRAMDRNGVLLAVYGGLLVTSPFLLTAGLDAGGMVGVIAVQAALMIGGRLACLAALNRVSGAHLPVLSRPREVVGVYRSAWDRGREWLRRRGSRSEGR